MAPILHPFGKRQHRCGGLGTSKRSHSGGSGIIPEDQLFTGKDLTFSIEQDNSNIRRFLARFRRRTTVVSKAVEMVDLSLRIYHYFHDNPRNFAALAATFLCDAGAGH
jgi:hypothetical protein